MSANTWGLFGTGLTLWLAVIGLPSQYLWLQPWFLFCGGVSFIASAICFSWPRLRRLVSDNRGDDFSDEKQSTVDSKLAALPLEVRRELYRIITGEIEVHQLNNNMRDHLEKVGFVNPAFAYTPAEFNEHHRPFIERWFRRNPL